MEWMKIAASLTEGEDQRREQEEEMGEGVLYVKVMTDEQKEILRRQIAVYATIYVFFRVLSLLGGYSDIEERFPRFRFPMLSLASGEASRFVKCCLSFPARHQLLERRGS